MSRLQASGRAKLRLINPIDANAQVAQFPTQGPDVCAHAKGLPAIQGELDMIPIDLSIEPDVEKMPGVSLESGGPVLRG